MNGYSKIFEKLLASPKIEVMLNLDFFKIKDLIPDETKIIYSGTINQYFNYKFGHLEYRSLRFEKEVLPYEDYQGT